MTIRSIHIDSVRQPDRRSRRPGASLGLGMAAGVALALAWPSLGFGQAPSNARRADLPDWSGVWQRIGRGVFDPATASPPDAAGAGAAGEREFPPYNVAWEAKYAANRELVAKERFPDPLNMCLPRGVPSMMNLPDGYEFIVRPEQVWILTENGAQIRRIYTDGRPHLSGDDLFPTYTGHAVGHWEGDTLVVDTVGLRDDMILDRTGAVLSGKATVKERIRKIDDNTLEDQMTIEDSEALTKPWIVTRRYRKLAPGQMIFDYACAENNRNPVDASGRPRTLGADGKPLD